jgi:hypothetical protein
VRDAMEERSMIAMHAPCEPAQRWGEYGFAVREFDISRKTGCEISSV